MHKVAPAIAAGCPFILKPSRKTPLCALKLGELLTQTEMPKGSFSVITTEEYDPFIEHEKIRVISFTGGAKAGWGIKEKAVKKLVVLELGGNAACIVDKDINDLDHIAQRICAGAFGYSGQSCISVQRILVHSSHYKNLCEKLVSEAEKFNKNRGNPADKNVLLGPLISESEAKRIEEWVDDAVKNFGGKILCGGKRHENFYEATFLSNVDKRADVSCKEAFGPIAIIQTFETLQEAIDITNDSDFGLQAGIFCNDLGKCFYAYEVCHFIFFFFFICAFKMFY